MARLGGRKHKEILERQLDPEQEISCPVCTGSNAMKLFRLPSHSILQCLGCGVHFNPAVRVDTATELFDASYHRKVQSRAFRSSHRGESDASAPIWSLAARYLARSLADVRVLDVGAASGSFMQLASSWGCSVRGIEISRDAVDEACGVHGIQIEHAPAERVEEVFRGQKFHLITMWDSIEHFQSIRVILRSVHDLLADDGILVIATDNFDSLVGDISRFIYSLSGRRISYPLTRFFIPYNSIYPTPQWLVSELTKQGFDIVDIRGIDYPIEKMNLSQSERLAVKLFYHLGERSERQTQTFLVARKSILKGA